MAPQGQTRCTAFAGPTCLATGDLLSVASAAKSAIDRGEAAAPILIFDDETGEPIEIDFRGPIEDVRARLASSSSATEDAEPTATRGPGRPKLGVTSREVTLLPRHWEWLNSQPGGASVALRKLVEHARRANAEPDRVRRKREAIYRFMTAMTGDLPGYEEALRALFAGHRERFEERVRDWPGDLRSYLERLAVEAF